MFVEPTNNWPKLNNSNKMASMNEREFSRKLPSGFICIMKYLRPLFASLWIRSEQLALLNLAAALDMMIFIIYELFLFITSFCTHILNCRNFYEEH